MSQENVTKKILYSALDLMVENDPSCSLVVEKLRELIAQGKSPNVATLESILSETGDYVAEEGCDENP